MSEPKSFPYRPGQPWLGVDRREEFEEFIAGNREGLAALRDAIDRALREGRAEIEVPFTEYPGIVLIEGDPRETETERVGVQDLLAGLLSVGLIGATWMGVSVALLLAFRWLWRLVSGGS